MKKYILSTTLAIITSTLIFAQNKILTIEEAVIGQHRELSPENLVNLQWQGNSNNIAFQDYYTIYSQELASKKTHNLVVINDINKALLSINQDSLNVIPFVKFKTKTEITFKNNNHWYLYSITNKSIKTHIKLLENATDLTFSSTGNIAYCIANNIAISNLNNEILEVTKDDNPDIVNGQSVSRNEFGIKKGLFWSNSGKQLAYYRKDNSKVADYPLVDITTREAKTNLIKYPMAGMSSEHISLGIYNTENNTTVFIEKEDTISEKYLTNITWGPADKYIYIQVLNREQNRMQLVKYDANTGKQLQVLFTETHDKYVEPQNKLLFINKNKFIYQTRTYGYNHAYLYNTNGELLKQITNGQWEITKLFGNDGKYLYYSATKESPIENHAYRTNISNLKTQKLTLIPGTHNIQFKNNFSAFIDTYSSLTIPRVIAAYNNNGTLISTIKKSDNPLIDYNMPKAEIGTIKSADDTTDLYFRLIKPINFDSTKSYPALIYVYGGPHAQLVTNSWLGGASLWLYYMAQKGYVVFTLDNRGSANRGLEFENVIHRQCGINEMKDQLEGVKFLQNLAYVNNDRIGVHGWSYGGFMTTSLMTNYPEVFKVGCAGGPVIDWKYYEVMYGERYMDTPNENPQGYLVTSLIPKAKLLKGSLLIIHGAVDPVVVMQHSQLFIRECIKENIPIDYFIYPRAEHNVRGKDRIHLMQKVSDYFDCHLKN